MLLKTSFIINILFYIDFSYLYFTSKNQNAFLPLSFPAFIHLFRSSRSVSSRVHI